jgi:predicted permease
VHEFRALRKQPGFTVMVVVTLALGIGANTAIFSLLNAVMLRSFAFADPARVVYLATPNRHLTEIPIDALGPSPADFVDWQREARSFSSLALFSTQTFNLAAASSGVAQRVEGVRVSGDFFSTLGVSPAWGRPIEARDDESGRADVAVISHALWQSAFGGDAAVLQRTLTLDGHPYRIVGIMPPAFRYPRGGDLGETTIGDEPTDVWVPLALTPQQRAEREPSDYSALGRLRPGVTLAQVKAEMTTIMARLDELHAPQMRGWYSHVRSSVDALLDDVRPLLWLLLGAVTLVLLIACSNAAHLLLARASGRAQEMGVRAALGASRWRLIRHTLGEALLLACGGGVLGVGLAFVAIRGLVQLDPGNIPRLEATSIDGRVLAFCVGLSLLTGIVFGLVPALTASRVDVADLLRVGGQGRTTASSHRWRRGLIVAQIGVAVVLLVGASLLVRSWVNLLRVNPGFSASTLTMRVSLDARYGERTQRIAFFRGVIDRARQIPGVQQVGLVDALPFSHSERLSFVEVEGYPNKQGQLLNARMISEGYFDAMGTPLVDGRSFDTRDADGRVPVVIVNQAFARTYVRDRPAIGARVRFGSGGDNNQAPWATIVGVVADVRHSNMEDAPPPQVYQPFWPNDNDSAYITVRGTVPAADIVAGLRRAVQAIDPMLAVAEARTMDQLVEESGARRRFQALLLGVFAGVALLLAVVGLYGLMAYSVKQRTGEIGIRLALGAPRGAVLRLFLGQGLRLTIVGLAIGAAGAFAVTRMLRAWLYEITPSDPLAFVVSALLLASAALLACYVPAGRAARVEPLVVLRRSQ